ncbi:uncharacterized protein BDW47DRAFT_124429 [Aspergillus candidus]|uniref:BZIP domain-containing protein n=1 Tax=Aspergillus candidus TaxID=41067 RepID=A0A2I2FFM1_ASPCN|nr:hypothetical protein BDW47DRAFT_124429 [Aspergillus candidus]PLB39430.1 hypothetical protein BDW47DRAFT_124429 [Aspergillus candidus]
MPMIPFSQGRLPRSSGRPRSGAASATVLSEERRSQIRRAQKTYRLKKAASLQETQQRVALLETKLQSISESLSDYRAALVSELQDSHPLVTGFDNIFDMVDCDRDQTRTTSQSPTDKFEVTRSYDPNPPNTPFGYHNDSSSSTTTTVETPTTPLRQQPSPTITPSPSTRKYTHAFRECSLSRQLQRYSLEHAFRLFTNAHSPPVEIYRVFRLVPCLRNRSKMYPYFRRLVCADTDNPLEVPTLPFYCIGGAGTHYPARDTAGNPIYPPKMRLPRRILSVGVDGSQRRLEACGLDGRWFDCRDVEGFLRERGVQVDGSLFPVVRESDSGSPGDGGGGDSAEYQLQMSLVESLGESVAPSRLDLESFFQRLLRGVVILGRVPGFRECDVVGAFKTSVVFS